jgi:Raf kinase inhibitor-like YbhB/YbcL family protein
LTEVKAVEAHRAIVFWTIYGSAKAISEMFVLEASAFRNNGLIPLRYTCDGENLSPSFSWRGAPVGTKSFTLICEDPDAPGGTFFHWAIWNISGDWTELAEGFNVGPTNHAIAEAINGFGRRGYGGPCPPKGDGPHHYHFRLFALDVERIPLEAKAARCEAVARAVRANVIGTAELTGLYQR